MVDLSKTEPSREFRNTYVAKYDRIIECINRQKAEFLSYYEQCEVIRKKRDAIIEGDLVKLLKSLDIKPSKPLGKFNNAGLIQELKRLINENPDKNTEEIEIAIIEIKKRYREIAKIARKMETYAQRIDNYPDEGYEANMEADYNDEVVIDISAIKRKNNIDKQQNDNVELEEVTGVHAASEETLQSLSNILDNYFGISKEISLEQNSDDDLDYDSIFMGTDEEYSEEELDIPQERKVEENEEEVSSVDLDAEENRDADVISIESYLNKEEVDYASFTINNDISFCDLVRHVYEEDSSEDYDSELWESVYNFSSNKDIIDKIAEDRGISIEDVVSTPGILKNVTLRFPTELTIYEQVSEGKTRTA